MLSKAFPFLSIVMLLFPMGVFMLGSPPLLILKHDTPLDSRFIRGLFNYYYNSVIVIAAFAAVGCAAMGRSTVALAMAALVAFVFVVRRWMLARMDGLREAIGRGDASAVPRFRRLHIAGMVLNVVQFGVAVWGLTRLATAQ
ncbi:MAG TPA: hypothetical protein VML58_09365 [Burkholderiaceae bacterium]|nr:hypothetical protein [Burkholderiaceae bacterium]